MNYFPNNDEEKSLLQFISAYQYLNVNDVKYFFSSKKYYRKRITNLVNKNFLRRVKLNLVLGKLGIEYIKMFDLYYNKLNRDQRYVPRLLRLSNIGAFYNNCKNVKFTPSFLIKDKTVFTVTARRFIGILDINGIEYLTYYVGKEHNNKYIYSVIYDIQKERQYKNIIIFVDDISKINFNNFAFGLNQVLIIEDTENNRNNLKYLNNVNWFNIVRKFYKNQCLSEYNFCEYTNYKDKYITTFFFVDTEKINRIKNFLRENKNRNVDIICNIQIKDIIKNNLPNANYIFVNLDEYIDKEINYYD